MSPTISGPERLVAGRRKFRHAQYLHQLERHDEAEALARESLRALRSAMDWLEDEPGFDEAHSRLDEAGTWVRSTYGCHLTFEDGTYYQDCPVAHAHVRMGLSPGMIVHRVECSICGENAEDCEHIRGQTYDGQVCARRMKDLEVLEVSLVGRPADPDARIHRRSVDRKELAEALGNEFAPGTPVSCDRCLAPCHGLSRPFGM